MAECLICELIESNDESIIYQDDKCAAVLSRKPASFGHMKLFPRQHFPIIENVPDYIVAHMFVVANKLSTAVFESLGMHGTNIIVQNGIDAGQQESHFMIHIIPRKQDDGLNFEWKPKTLSQEELSTVELQLMRETQNIGDFQTEAAKPAESDEEDEIEGDNYLIRQLRRIP